MWPSGLNICVVDGREANRHTMASKLAAINSSWSVQFHDGADEQVLHTLDGIDILILGNQLGTERMNGLQAVQLIRNHTERDLIIILFSNDIEENPGANLVWSEDTSIEVMAEDIKCIVMSPALQETAAVTVNYDDEMKHPRH